MFKLSQIVVNNIKSNNKFVYFGRFEKYLKSSMAEAKNQPLNESDVDIKPEESVKPTKTRNSMVAAAFASLKPEKAASWDIKTPVTDDKISKATSIDEILSISEGYGISRKTALKVVSTLAEWSTSGKAKVSDFENDARFIKLCRILSKGAKINRNISTRSEDLSTVLNVTADEEAARLISGLSLPQMVKVMTTLSLKKRRSVLMLRTLAYNITASSEQLNLKQSADLLYSMCLLNFIDNNLLDKICVDVSNDIRKDLKTSAVIGSIITSLGLLKYQNCEIMDTLSEWILKNHAICRPQDIFSLFTTLAIINYSPSNSEELFNTLLPQMSAPEARKPVLWLNFVWSLIILNKASTSDISSVLCEDFVKKIEGSTSLNINSKLKLLNINGAAKNLVENYDGVLLPPSSSIHNVSVAKTKEKLSMIETVVETLKNLISTENHIRLHTNTGLGCSIDVECLLDKKCASLPFDDGNENKENVTRVAIQVYDYHDMCIGGKIAPTGPNVLAARLLQSQNYKILTIPYTEFKVTDKLIHRVQYLENKLKRFVQ